MGQTLPHGVYLPDNGERNCYTGLSQNWQKLDNLIGSHGDTVSFAQTLTEGVEIGKITINGVEVSMFHTDYSDKADADNVYTKAEVDTSLSAKADSSDLSNYLPLNGGVMSGDLRGNGSNNLGTSTNKWKTINGVNPGALSLPSTNSADCVPISGHLTDLTGGDNFYTPPSDGWIFMRSQSCSKMFINSQFVWVEQRPNVNQVIGLTCPVRANVRVTIAVQGSVQFAYFVPCQGNV